MYLSDQVIKWGHMTNWKQNIFTCAILAATKSDKVVTYNVGSLPEMSMTLWPSGHMRSREKLKTKYPLFLKDFGYQTWQIGDIWWEKTIYGVAWSSGNVVMCGYVTN